MDKEEEIKKIIEELVNRGISPSRARRIAMKKIKLKGIDKVGAVLDEMDKLDGVLADMGEEE